MLLSDKQSPSESTPSAFGDRKLYDAAGLQARLILAAQLCWMADQQAW